MATNLLFVTIDDLFSLSAWPIYDSIVQTPNLDALRGTGIDFSAAFADVAICNPSRASILTGQQPWDTGILTNHQELSQVVDIGSETLPGMLKANGFHVTIGGKVFHSLNDAEAALVADTVIDAQGLRNTTSNVYDSVANTFYGAAQHDLLDTDLANKASAYLADYDSADPLALFVGIYRPHASWVVPQEFLDLYDGIEIPIPDFVDDSERAEFAQAMRTTVFHDAVLADDVWEDVVRHYLASVSYADALLGQLLEALEASDLSDDTAIMVMSDHGYHLGDAENWHKFSLHEQAARAPLILSLPGGDAQEITAPVNLSSVAATALEILGLDPSPWMQPSLMSLIEGPATGLEAAITWMNGSFSIRTDQYRYTAYETGEEDLYDIKADIFTQTNLAEVLPEITAQFRVLAETYTANMFIRSEVPVHGGPEDNIYYLNDRLVEISDDGGIDTVVTNRDYVLQDGLENLIGIRLFREVSFTGNALDNKISSAGHNDVIFGLGGNDSIFASTGDDTVDGGEGDDNIVGGSGNDLLKGAGGRDVIMGEHGDDVLHGEDGDDTLLGGAGSDTLHGGAGDDYLDGQPHDDELYGGSGNDTLIGGNGVDLLVAGDGDDHLDGGFGDDTLEGGLGNDVYLFVSPSDVILEQAAEGIDLLITSFNLTLPEHVEIGALVLDRDLRRALTGNEADNTLYGGLGTSELNGTIGRNTLDASFNIFTGETYASADILIDEDGGDTMIGGAGDDRYYTLGTDLGISQIVETEDGGIDIQYALHDIVLAEHVENAELTGAASAKILGNAGNNQLRGNAGANILIGDAGDDELFGGDGDDVLIGGRGADTHRGGSGQDRVSYSSALAGVTANLTDHFENTNDALGDRYDSIEDLYGTAFADTLVGDAADNDINGADGDDSLLGAHGEDRLWGGAGHDTLSGGAGADVLNSGAGDDLLIGGTGSDILRGGGGVDTVAYHDASEPLVVDLINSALNTSDAAGDRYNSIEGLIGGAFSDWLAGNDLSNSIDAGHGNDTVSGRLGDDHLSGGSGNDLLRGNAGSDSLHGGEGDDRLRGQKAGDLLDGGDGDDNLKGGGGNDTLLGGAGSDFLNGGTREDSIDGGAGDDLLLGRSFDDTLIGGEGKDSLNAGAGDDLLNGGAGNDRLMGGEGADVFVFDTGFGIDRIVDIDLSEDRLHISVALAAGRDATEIAALAREDGSGYELDFGDGDRLRLLSLESDSGLSDRIDII